MKYTEILSTGAVGELCDFEIQLPGVPECLLTLDWVIGPRTDKLHKETEAR